MDSAKSPAEMVEHQLEYIRDNLPRAAHHRQWIADKCGIPARTIENIKYRTTLNPRYQTVFQILQGLKEFERRMEEVNLVWKR